MNLKRKAATTILSTVIAGLGIASCGDHEGEGVRVEGDLFIRYFDIKYLCHPAETHVDEDVLVPGGPAPPEPPVVTAFCSQEAVVAFVSETIGGDAAWEDPATIEVRNGIIVARNTTTILDAVQALLDEIRATGGLPAYLETQDQGP